MNTAPPTTTSYLAKLCLDFVEWMRNDYRTQFGKQPTHNGQTGCVVKMKTFFRWCANSGRADIDISAWVPSAAFKPKPSRLLSVEALRRLFEAAGPGPQSDS